VTKSILPQTILLIENDPAVAAVIQAALANSRTGAFEVELVGQLSAGIARLSKKGIGCVLVNLLLSDSQGIETFDRLHSVAPDVPVLILGDANNEALAKEAVDRGAQDYLLPGHLNSYSLPRALRNWIERKAVVNIPLKIPRRRSTTGQARSSGR
jgi:DNA-binding NarL/FixJ family response regulator